jgi:Ca2+-binding EF-hand superfamily protein
LESAWFHSFNPWNLKCVFLVKRIRCFQIQLVLLHFVCKKINPGKGLEEAKSQVAWMDKDGDGQVDQDEYVRAMSDLMDDIDQETFDAGVNKVLMAVKFAYASREEKLRMVFDKIDADGSGELDKEELTMLAKALVPGGDETKVKKTMAWLDKDGDSNVSFDEFKGPMLHVTAGLYKLKSVS